MGIIMSEKQTYLTAMVWRVPLFYYQNNTVTAIHIEDKGYNLFERNK